MQKDYEIIVRFDMSPLNIHKTFQQVIRVNNVEENEDVLEKGMKPIKDGIMKILKSIMKILKSAEIIEMKVYSSFQMPFPATEKEVQKIVEEIIPSTDCNT